MRTNQAETPHPFFRTAIVFVSGIAILSLGALHVAAGGWSDLAAGSRGQRGVTWGTNYPQAYAQAKREGRMLIVDFVAAGDAEDYRRQFDAWLAGDEAVQTKLLDFVLVRVSNRCENK